MACTTFGENYDYNAFGDFYESPTSMTTNFAYAGQQYDDQTGLYFTRAPPVGQGKSAQWQ